MDYYLLLNVARDNAPYLSLRGPNHLQLKFNSKMQDVKRVLDLNCKCSAVLFFFLFIYLL